MSREMSEKEISDMRNLYYTLGFRDALCSFCSMLRSTKSNFDASKWAVQEALRLCPENPHAIEITKEGVPTK